MSLVNAFTYDWYTYFVPNVIFVITHIVLITLQMAMISTLPLAVLVNAPLIHTMLCSTPQGPASQCLKFMCSLILQYLRLAIHSIPFLLFVFLDDLLAFLRLIPQLLRKVCTVEWACAAQSQPRAYTFEIKEMGRVAGKLDDKWVRVLEKRVVADWAGLVRLQF